MQELFSDDYATARKRFRETAAEGFWQLESYAVQAAGPAGEELTVDVAIGGFEDSERTLVVTSGVHGVEGFFGSAAQLSLMRSWNDVIPDGVRLVLVHALNPYGFAWLRRCDDSNVDLNRNFLPVDEAYGGHPAGYASLSRLLNPQRPPSRADTFALQAAGKILRHGLPELRQAIAGGQYDFPAGLFFGGREPSPTLRLLNAEFTHWLGDASRVIHLDLHSGLGKHGECKLLVNYAPDSDEMRRLCDWLGPEGIESSAKTEIGYQAKGSLGQWCAASRLADEYYYLCAEFGTYSSLKVLAGLRGENQAHHWGTQGSDATLRAKSRLKELFCPVSPLWREMVVGRCVELAGRAVDSLQVH